MISNSFDLLENDMMIYNQPDNSLENIPTNLYLVRCMCVVNRVNSLFQMK